MKITKDIQAQARRLMRLCMSPEGLLIEENVRKIADGITASKPRNYIALLTAFTNLVRLEQETRTATITSALPLTDDEKASICAKLNARTPGLHYVWQVDPELIGGVIVKVGDDVTDASIRSRIERLSKISV